MELSTPLPPDELMILVCGHADRELFARSRRDALSEGFFPLLEQAHVDVAGCRTILDFGCGCGRLLAGWEARLGAGTQLYGVDVNPRLAAFCQDNIGFASVSTCALAPPLAFADGAFDLVYAVSVFTHLSWPNAQAWSKELARIVPPGRTLVATFHGDWYDHKLAEVAGERAVGELHHRGWYVHRFGQGNEGSNDVATFITETTVPQLFPDFEVIARRRGSVEGPTHFAAHQDAALMRRRAI